MPDSHHPGGATIAPPIPVPGLGEPLAFVTPARDWLLTRMVRARETSDAKAMQAASGLYNALAPYGERPGTDIPAELHQRLAAFAAA